MNLSLNSKTVLFAFFYASSKAASLSTRVPTCSSMSCKATLKPANDLFVVISPLKERGKTNYLPIGSEGVFGRSASLNHEEPPSLREEIFKKSIKNQNFRIKG